MQVIWQDQSYLEVIIVYDLIPDQRISHALEIRELSIQSWFPLFLFVAVERMWQKAKTPRYHILFPSTRTNCDYLCTCVCVCVCLWRSCRSKSSFWHFGMNVNNQRVGQNGWSWSQNRLWWRVKMCVVSEIKNPYPRACSDAPLYNCLVINRISVWDHNYLGNSRLEIRESAIY